MKNNLPKVEVTENGPYIVSVNIPLIKGVMKSDPTGNPTGWHMGDSIPVEDGGYYLCRCGHSSNKPFCDDTHLSI